MSDDETGVIQNLLLVDIPLTVLIIVNMVNTFGSHGGNLFAGKWNTILTWLILVTIVVTIIFSSVIMSLPDTDEATANAFSGMGVVIPGIYLIVYGILIALHRFKTPAARAPVPGSTYVVLRGGRRHSRSSGK